MNSLHAMEVDVIYGRGASKRLLLSHFNLHLQESTLCAVIGANGAGKSSLLRVLAGVQNAQQGSIEWNGEPVQTIPVCDRPRYVAALFRDFSRVDGLTVYDLASMGRAAVNGSWFGQLSASDHTTIREVLEATGMAAFAERQLGTLSDGEFQKAMLAKLLAQDAPIMLLDEPTTHLDLPSSLELMHMLQRLARDFKKTIVFTSHELHLVFKMAQTVVLLGGDGTYAYGSAQYVAQHSLMCHFLRTDEISIMDGNLHFKISKS